MRGCENGVMKLLLFLIPRGVLCEKSNLFVTANKMVEPIHQSWLSGAGFKHRPFKTDTLPRLCACFPITFYLQNLLSIGKMPTSVR